MTARSVQIAARAEVMAYDDFIGYIDEVIKEIQADTLKEAAERAVFHINSLGTVYSGTDHYIAVDPYNFEDGLTAAIIADKQEE